MALEKRRAVYGDAHLDVAETLFYLGKVHRIMDTPLAEADFRMALRITQELLGKDHPLTACTQAHLAYVLEAFDEEGKLEEAERLCRKSLAVLRRAPDDLHEGKCLPRCLQFLGDILVSRGEPEGAVAALTESLQILGQNDSSAGAILGKLGRIARHKGDLTTAESYLRRALAARSQELGDRHLALAWINRHLALTFRDQRRFDEAEAHCLVMLDIYLDSLGIDNRHINETLIDLKSILIARNDISYARQVTGGLMEKLRGAYPGKESRLAELHLHLLVPDGG
jgi:tetratricopeptide (TPR) repeat protein